MERVKVKVLVNQHQQSLENTKTLEYRHGKDYDPDSDSLLFRIFGEGNFINPSLIGQGIIVKGIYVGMKADFLLEELLAPQLLRKISIGI